jgi:CrcB protein
VAAVAAGGLVGSASRTAIGWLLSSETGEFPTAVVVVNLVGSFVLGLYMARRERAVTRPRSLQFWAIGVLGSFTTFSAFSLDLVDLMNAGRPDLSMAYLGVSLVGGLLVAGLGLRIGTVVE